MWKRDISCREVLSTGLLSWLNTPCSTNIKCKVLTHSCLRVILDIFVWSFDTFDTYLEIKNYIRKIFETGLLVMFSENISQSSIIQILRYLYNFIKSVRLLSASVSINRLNKMVQLPLSS